MDFVFPAPATVSLPIQGGGRFPVRRIFCVGQNYAAHAREMGGDPDRQQPFFFSKPADAVVQSGSEIAYPSMSRNVHHEIELVVALGEPGHDISPGQAQALVFGYAAGVDLTRRDLQAAAKSAGRPWDMAKGFDDSAPVAEITPVAAAGPMDKGAIWLSVNGRRRQSSDLSDLIWSVPELLSNLSKYMALRPGDLVYSGTPSGVGPLEPGDRVVGHVNGLAEISFSIAR